MNSTKQQAASSTSPPRPGENANASSSGQSSSTRRLGVLGIGLVMEEAGKGARLVFRYPSAPAPIFFNQSNGDVDESKTVPPNSSPNKKGGVRLSTTGDSSDSEISADSNSIDLFFDLPARVVSKLFRPKRPLCGQPLTLNVSGTTFCCRAELFDSQPSTVGGDGSNHPLVLFSVIVALAPLASSDGAAAPATQFDRANPADNTTNAAPQKRSDFAFSAIRRVHDNLASLCRVLKREELRCRYVSRQCSMLLQVRKEFEAREGPDDDRRGNEGGGTSSKSGMDGSTSNNDLSSSPKDKRSVPPPPVTTKVNKETNNRDDESRPKMTPTERRDYVQNLVEIMLAANCQTTPTEDSDDDSDGDEYKQQLYGNLARELARVFHCLSTDSTTVNPSSLLGANTGEGRVYINRHISVPIVPLVAEESSLQTHETELHPYHTLLFPKLTPSEILQDLQNEHVESAISINPNSLSIIRILRQVLPITHPRRSLNEVAFDAGIPLPYVMNAAFWLIKSKLCVAAMPVLRRNRYICVENVIPKIQSLQLAFWQEFGLKCRNHKFLWGNSSPPHIFVVISALTTTCSTQEGKKLVSSDPPTLGDAIASSGTGNEEIVYSMAQWLVARRIIVEMN
eukprot:scaffold13219_cov106-Skeletonema_marinoi.AAC.5